MYYLFFYLHNKCNHKIGDLNTWKHQNALKQDFLVLDIVRYNLHLFQNLLSDDTSMKITLSDTTLILVTDVTLHRPMQHVVNLSDIFCFLHYNDG